MQDLICYKELPVWTAQTIPQGFKNQHNTKAGTWAKLKIYQGELSFAFLDEAGQVQSEHLFTAEQQPPFIQPQAWHKIVSTSDDIECQLQFYCTRRIIFIRNISFHLRTQKFWRLRRIYTVVGLWMSAVDKGEIRCI
jgi:tellurite methyltransferase